MVEIDVGGRRCGVAPGAPAARLAERVAGSAHLRFAGLQAYHGSAQHVREARERGAHIARAVEHVKETLECPEGRRPRGRRSSAGPAPGTYENEAASAVYNELQAGSYIFMDADYARNKRGERRALRHLRACAVRLRHRDERAGAGAARRRCRAQGARRRQRHAGALAACRARCITGPPTSTASSTSSACAARPGRGDKVLLGPRPLRSHGQPARLVRRRARARRRRGARGMPVAGGGARRSVLIPFAGRGSK